MATYTEHYGLHQWLPEDNFLRTDFNTDLEKIDTVLGQKIEVITGSYAGNNTARDIALGFQPKAVLLFTNTGYTNYSGTTFGGLFTPEKQLMNSSRVAAEITATGFRLYGAMVGDNAVNRAGDTYVYLAIKG